MASNSFGTLFRITTWGESHGKAIGVVIDGCPAGLDLSENIIQLELDRRRPGEREHTSPRNETDCVAIYSGVFEGKTTGAPISLIIPNRDADSSKYLALQHVMRPGHANFTYLEKYGIYDYRGGGRASARETACRVAAGAVAKQLLKHYDIQIAAYLSQVGEVSISDPIPLEKINLEKSALFCPFPAVEKEYKIALKEAAKKGDSLGGIVTFCAENVPQGLGDPIYEKLEAKLANAFLSLPATKSFEMGEGAFAATMKGSEHNDSFTYEDEQFKTATNHSGGVLGGISTGMPLWGRVAFKPTSSIAKSQQTVNREGETTLFKLPEGSRHDPCVAIRAVPVVEAMLALVLADLLLHNRLARL